MKPELQQRIITAVVLVPLVIWCIFFAPDASAFRAFAAAVVTVAAWEWTAMMGWKSRAPRAAYAGLVLALLFLLILVPLPAGLPAWLYGSALLFWMLAHRLVRAYPADTAVWASGPVLFVIGLLLLVPAWLGLTSLHGKGAWWLLYLLLLVWGADTGAYFAGRAFGRRKLAPAVSPGKTLEGFFGGLALTMALALGVALWQGFAGQRLLAFLALSLITVLASVLGDLFESMVKRRAGLKDSGTIFPGHGGALDRIDSLTAAAPVFALGFLLGGF